MSYRCDVFDNDRDNSGQLTTTDYCGMGVQKDLVFLIIAVR